LASQLAIRHKEKAQELIAFLDFSY